MISTSPLISKSFGNCSSAPVTIGITVIFMLYSFLVLLQGLLIYISVHFLFILFRGIPGQQNLLFSWFSFLLTIARPGRLVEIRWSFSTSKYQRILCLSFSKTAFELCIYCLFLWSNFNFLHYSPLIILPTQSCFVFNSFCVNLQHSLIIWFIVSSLSPYYLHLLFCYVLSILALT